MTFLAATLPRLAFGAADGAVEVAATYHCAGMSQLAGCTNLSTLQKAMTLSSAPAFHDLILSRLAILLAANFKLGTNPATAALLEPLVNDVLSTESLGSFGGPAANAPSFVLALRLDAKREQAWQENLGKALGGPGEKLTAEGFDGWQWKRGASDLFWIVRANEYLLVGRGGDLLAVRSEYLGQVKRQGRPGPALTDHWLEGDVDLPRLAACSPDWARLFKPARIQFSLAAGASNLQMSARVIYPEAIPWQSGSWQIPRGLVPSRFNSLTAGQDIAAFMNLDPKFSRLDANPFTNQFYLWALGGMPFITYAAWPTADSTNELEKLSKEAVTNFSSELKKFNGTELVWQTNLHRLVLGNLRVVIPTLEAGQDKAGQYLLMSFFPHMPVTQPAPDELWKEIRGRTNLVYYDWELTGSRLQDWRLLGRIMLLRYSRITTDEMANATRIEDKWLTDLIPWWSGNAVTEVTRVAPNELAVVRNSPLGFSGIEIFLLTEWLSDIGSEWVDSPASSAGSAGGAPVLPP